MGDGTRLSDSADASIVILILGHRRRPHVLGGGLRRQRPPRRRSRRRRRMGGAAPHPTAPGSRPAGSVCSSFRGWLCVGEDAGADAARDQRCVGLDQGPCSRLQSRRLQTSLIWLKREFAQCA